ncbi:transposase [Desulfotomaculum copahuensis]|uniref:Transposase n=1 Tax=Desulfotomaculum copahuensis TaxID=1838280 RepID=A0A1B7LAE0_9FIRM|nr:transposase [Desulfotomaculum copahuensis]OAT79296.1 transposase [Desulfotomaculum copahuensis]
MTRKRYPKEFKDQLIQEVAEIGNAVPVAKRHEVNLKTLYRWISQSRHKAWQVTSAGTKKTAVYIPSHQEFRQLESENEKLKKILGEKDLEIAILRDLVKKQPPGFQTE